MNNRFETNADANARLAMLDKLNKRRGGETKAQDRGGNQASTADSPKPAKAKAEPASVARSRPVNTPIFDDLHEALEALRRQPAHLREVAAERLAEARRWCDLGEFKRALTELSNLASELTSDGFFSVRPAKKQEQWASEEIVVGFGAA